MKLSAANSRLKVGATPVVIPFKEMEFEVHAIWVDSMSSESGGFEEWESTAVGGNGRFIFDYDDAAGVLTNMVPGTKVPIEVDLSRAGTPPKFVGTFAVEGGPFKGRMKELIGLTVAGKLTGTFTYPSQ